MVDHDERWKGSWKLQSVYTGGQQQPDQETSICFESHHNVNEATLKNIQFCASQATFQLLIYFPKTSVPGNEYLDWMTKPSQEHKKNNVNTSVYLTLEISKLASWLIYY